ncbi:hypothetical protein Cri9333_1948 [Crinalium epipsammum PCC 9333]|uniref:Uncharacterized protein n=1 Tax=Crinalium epipsammum PCC 9333 TaxID=1173022 RepID=K9VZ59_9CYAN|nr:hypothetical protein [Crinalium epipsammum]AFZ12829.1 hypothetical protein Cri9333_1948 [Crinalium epipsammum PCC 9333]
MTTHFISAEIDLEESTEELQQAIKTELEKRGEPLRWAVSNVDQERGKVQLEAIVTVAENSTK